MQTKIISASRFDFTGEDGRPVKGCKITTLGPVENDSRSKGHQIFTYSGDVSLWDKMPAVPGDYDVDFLHYQSQNKIAVKIQDIRPFK